MTSRGSITLIGSAATVVSALAFWCVYRANNTGTTTKVYWSRVDVGPDDTLRAIQVREHLRVYSKLTDHGWEDREGILSREFVAVSWGQHDGNQLRSERVCSADGGNDQWLAFWIAGDNPSILTVRIDRVTGVGTLAVWQREKTEYRGVGQRAVQRWLAASRSGKYCLVRWEGRVSILDTASLTEIAKDGAQKGLEAAFAGDPYFDECYIADDARFVFRILSEGESIQVRVVDCKNGDIRDITIPVKDGCAGYVVDCESLRGEPAFLVAQSGSGNSAEALSVVSGAGVTLERARVGGVTRERGAPIIAWDPSRRYLFGYLRGRVTVASYEKVLKEYDLSSAVSSNDSRK